MWNSSFWIVTSTLIHQGHQHLEATATAFFLSKPSHQLHLGLYIGWALLVNFTSDFILGGLYRISYSSFDNVCTGRCIEFIR